MGIYLNDDVTVETRKAREDFRSVAALARLKGATVRVHDDGLILDGVKYKLFEPHSLPTQYSLAKAKTIEVQGDLYFQSEHSYLSNFHKAPIMVDDDLYPTAEHKYQADKCRAGGDEEAWNRVMTASTPLEAKRIGDTVNETAEWRQNKEKAMADTINLKFDQNPQLAKLLIDTGNAALYEATNNTFFGIGASLHSREIKDKSYRGMNKLGLIIMEKRQRLIADKQ